MSTKLSFPDVDELKTVSGYSFSGKNVKKLEGADEYTLAVIEIDCSGSVMPFKADLEAAVGKVIDACRKSPSVEKILVRVTKFDDGLEEIHGFVPLFDVKPEDYKDAIDPGGMTALHDATLDSIESIQSYSKQLNEKEFSSNAIVFIITDGCENASKIANPDKIAKAITQCHQDEILESVKIVLIGIGSESIVESYLKDFKDQVGIDQFVWVGEATPGKLAKLAEFISKSVSSTSQSLGSGGASQNIDF